MDETLLVDILSQDAEIPSRTTRGELKMDDLVIRLKEEELRAVQLKNDSTENDAELRQRYANWMFCFLAVYMIASVVIVILCGVAVLNISDGVLMTMLGTTTANVIGLFAYVMKYLFPSNS